MFCVMKIHPGLPFPDCVLDMFMAGDNHDACRQADRSGENDLATFFYRAEFFGVPAGQKIKIPVVSNFGHEYWALG